MRTLLPRMIFAAVLIATFVAAVLPAGPSLVPSDKANHMIAFVVLAVLAAWAFPDRRLWTIGAGLAAFGGAIEIVQGLAFVGRDAEWADWGADLAAIAITLGIVALVRAARVAPARVKP